MAFPTAVNDQITDAVTHSNIKVIGEAPVFATTLAAMIHEPHKAAEYEAVLQVIKRME